MNRDKGQYIRYVKRRKTDTGFGRKRRAVGPLVFRGANVTGDPKNVNNLFSRPRQCNMRVHAKCLAMSTTSRGDAKESNDAEKTAAEYVRAR